MSLLEHRAETLLDCLARFLGFLLIRDVTHDPGETSLPVQGDFTGSKVDWEFGAVFPLRWDLATCNRNPADRAGSNLPPDCRGGAKPGRHDNNL